MVPSSKTQHQYLSMALVSLGDYRDQLKLAFQLSLSLVEFEQKYDFQRASGLGSRTHN
jgi:hypothetical protein